MSTNDVVYEEYRKGVEERQNQQIEMASLSTKAQLDQLAENKKLVEAEKQNAFRGAYVDYAKNINPYGVQSELAYGAGLGGAGKGETAQANYYNTYQNRLGEINTNTTNQLRDIANQETSVRLAGDQAKLDIATTYGQQLADAKYARDQQLESYAREDKNNAYTRIMNAISAGYNPTDEELAAAGMSRPEANAYINNYKRSLYSGSGASASKEKTITTSQETLANIRDQLQVWRDGGNTKQITAYLDQAVLGGIISEGLADALYEEYIVPINTRSGQVSAARANAARTNAARANVAPVNVAKANDGWSYLEQRLGVK